MEFGKDDLKKLIDAGGRIEAAGLRGAEALRRAQLASKQAEYMSSTMRDVLDDITGASRRATLPRWRRWLIRLLAR